MRNVHVVVDLVPIDVFTGDGGRNRAKQQNPDVAKPTKYAVVVVKLLAHTNCNTCDQLLKARIGTLNGTLLITGGANADLLHARATFCAAYLHYFSPVYPGTLLKSTSSICFGSRYCSAYRR